MIPDGYRTLSLTIVLSILILGLVFIDGSLVSEEVIAALITIIAIINGAKGYDKITK